MCFSSKWPNFISWLCDINKMQFSLTCVYMLLSATRHIFQGVHSVHYRPPCFCILSSIRKGAIHQFAVCCSKSIISKCKVSEAVLNYRVEVCFPTFKTSLCISFTDESWIISLQMTSSADLFLCFRSGWVWPTETGQPFYHPSTEGYVMM